MLKSCAALPPCSLYYGVPLFIKKLLRCIIMKPQLIYSLYVYSLGTLNSSLNVKKQLAASFMTEQIQAMPLRGIHCLRDTALNTVSKINGRVWIIS